MSLAKFTTPNTKEYYEFWTDHGASLKELADMEGIDQSTMSRRLKKFGVTTSKKKHKVVKMQVKTPKPSVELASPPILPPEPEYIEPIPIEPNESIDESYIQMIQYYKYAQDNGVEVNPNVVLSFLDKTKQLVENENEILKVDEFVDSLKGIITNYFAQSDTAEFEEKKRWLNEQLR